MKLLPKKLIWIAHRRLPHTRQKPNTINNKRMKDRVAPNMMEIIWNLVRPESEVVEAAGVGSTGVGPVGDGEDDDAGVLVDGRADS